MSKELKEKNKEYIRGLRTSVARILDLTRQIAAEEMIIKNSTGSISPSKATALQPSTPGRLTSRTGKLAWSVRQKIAANPETFWEGFNRKLAKIDLPVMKGNVRTKGNRKIVDFVDGSLSLKRAGQVTMSGRLSNRGAKSVGYMPKETGQTMRMRYIWEFASLKGSGGKRQFMDPAAKIAMRKFNSVFDVWAGKVWSR